LVIRVPNWNRNVQLARVLMVFAPSQLNIARTTVRQVNMGYVCIQISMVKFTAIAMILFALQSVLAVLVMDLKIARLRKQYQMKN
jgi:hypothetical protein